jgi:hypothetical protein
LKGLSQAGNRGTAELQILQPDFVPFLLQPGRQIQKPQRHGQAFTDRVGRVDEKDFHDRIVSNAVDKKKTLDCISKRKMQIAECKFSEETHSIFILKFDICTLQY